MPGGSGPDFPSNRDVPFDDHQKVEACLARRAFSSVRADNVSYVHRTVAEFLAAKWLSGRVREGLPIRRVQNLIGIEGHPAPELRGLHAWLAILLPEHAPVLMSHDPYGVLVYGDAASLSVAHRQTLFTAIEDVSKNDPWFRTGRSDSSLGALSGPDMAGSFRRILSDPASSSQLRGVILDAIANGPSLPELLPDLA